MKATQPKYSIEPHGDGYVIYFGRNSNHHGSNLCFLSGFDKNERETIAAIEKALFLLNQTCQYSDVIKEIADNYHDRSCMSGLMMENQTCGCCERIVSTTSSIEHDSQDYSKDKNVCSDCYAKIAMHWKKNKPGKIAPI